MEMKNGYLRVKQAKAAAEPKSEGMWPQAMVGTVEQATMGSLYQVGDRVCFEVFVPTQLHIDGEDFTVVNERSVIAVL